MNEGKQAMITGILLRLDSLEEYAALDDQQFGKLIRAGLQFAIDGTEPDISPPESYLWPGMKLKILHDAEKYRRKCEQNALNIRKRWGRQKPPENNSIEYDGIRTYTNDTNNNINNNNNDNNNGNVNIGDSEGIPGASSGGKPHTARFTPPTVEDVRQYCQERKNGIDPEYFVDYYQRSGWIMSNGQRMKDWKAAVRTWEQNQRGGRNGLSRANKPDRVPGQRDLYEC